MDGDRKHGGAALAVRIMGVVFALIGVVLAIGGVQLIALGGSWYYLLAGLGLMASGALLFRLDVRGAWLYLAVYVLTVLWALWEVGLNGWALVPRVIAPSVLLLLLALAACVLAAAFTGADVVGADEESLDDAAGVEVEDEVPADTVDFDFERESLR